MVRCLFCKANHFFSQKQEKSKAIMRLAYIIEFPFTLFVDFAQYTLKIGQPYNVEISYLCIMTIRKQASIARRT